jgi:hypothetical protein
MNRESANGILKNQPAWITHARAAAGQFHLPFHARNWRGRSGNWAGTGTGSSIDFQDHRPYLPGDDPRYIDWRAYARTGSYAMKLYREEVSPVLEIAVDASPSMAWESAKLRRSHELLYFAVENGLRCGSVIKIHWVGSGEVRPMVVEEILGRAELPFGHSGEYPAGGAMPCFERIPWQAGSLRVVLSDGLFKMGSSGGAVPACFAAAKGWCLWLAPHCEAERNPDWNGNVELEDCESGARRRQRVEGLLMERYRESYQRHFALLAADCRKEGVLLARVDADLDLIEALSGEPCESGAVCPAY